MTSKIEWCQETWNPVVGRSKISAGCENCYAEKMACRLAHMGNRAYQDVITGHDSANWFQKWNGKTAFVESQLEKPDKWKKPRRIFVCSMGDLFHDSVPLKWIEKVFEVVFRNPQHTFILKGFTVVAAIQEQHWHQNATRLNKRLFWQPGTVR